MSGVAADHQATVHIVEEVAEALISRRDHSNIFINGARNMLKNPMDCELDTMAEVDLNNEFTV